MQLLISKEQCQVEVKAEIMTLIREAMEKILEEEEFSHDFIDTAEVSMVLCDDQQMADLNSRYRGIPDTTDVLSFPMLDSEDEFVDFTDEVLLGDIVISVPRALEQADEYGHSLVREMVFLSIHGLLHLLGYDHQTEDERKNMRAKEKKVLGIIGLIEEHDEDGRTKI
ncbi:MAG: rRNA maturation RNase YbeY [Syntrophaceticus sp.]|nr:rRNA maturation RNase YbeY [Syntrophaceticus sp.]HBG22803.1 rRNA maturation RNase YbeY [Peptococcaceae bacterium]MDD3314888.1 rRNA maturation RNase YbeY [Syntrophaceticus sp.]MDD4360286.1 rRNA maturation RNase YbeY [Syntrophaceticus sp.]MDD4783234.1 rRNA maturation RNase YbeY [Syntrophaceticus sp.]